MEDILASIRRIIADDQDSGPELEAPEPGSSPLNNVLDLAERHIAPILHSDASVQERDGWADRNAVHGNVYPMDSSLAALVSTYEAEQTAQKVTWAGRPVQAEATETASGEALLSARAEASVSEAFGRLGAAMPQSQPQSMEDVVKEMLRPMLKAWLEDNLPALVERIVQDEIERVARRRA